jgi:hypothetical protein
MGHNILGTEWNGTGRLIPALSQKHAASRGSLLHRAASTTNPCKLSKKDDEANTHGAYTTWAPTPPQDPKQNSIFSAPEHVFSRPLPSKMATGFAATPGTPAFCHRYEDTPKHPRFFYCALAPLRNTPQLNAYSITL